MGQSLKFDCKISNNFSFMQIYLRNSPKFSNFAAVFDRKWCMKLDLLQLASAFVVLFAIIDPLGSIPIVLNLERKVKVEPFKVSIVAYIIMLLFLFAGEWILTFFGVDLASFAVAGAIILFLMALEMVLDIEIFKNNGPEGTGSLIPLAFPLFAGPGVFTALITIRAEYNVANIVTALTLNMIFLFFLLYSTKSIRKILGESGIYIIRKFFGIILMAISVKIFTQNLNAIFG